MDQGTRRRERGQRLVVAGYSAALTLLIAGPLLGPGHLLLRDAVSTPRSHLTDSALGLGDAAPRAVPQDALLATVSTVVDGGVAVKTILLLALWSAGYGAAVLVRTLLGRTTLVRGSTGPDARPGDPAAADARGGAHGEQEHAGEGRAQATAVGDGDRLADPGGAHRGGVASLRPIGKLTVPLGAQLVAVTVTLWNPYVAERLLQGHWSLLAGYAALPWTAWAAYLIRAAAHGRQESPTGSSRAAGIGRWAALAACLAAAGLTPTGALLAALVAIVTIGWRGAPMAAALALLASAPWLTATALSGAGADPSDPAGASAFAARAEPGLGTLGSLAGLGGIWNADAVPDSRTTLLAVIGTLALLAVVATGVRAVYSARSIAVGPDAPVPDEGADTTRPNCDTARSVRRALVWLALAAVVLPALAATGWGVAAMEAVIADVPGAGLLRDTQKYVALAVPGYALCAAAGCLALAEGWRRRTAAGSTALVAAAFIAVLMLPLLDLAWGVGGQLRPVRYPAGWERVAAEVHGDADVAVLPGGMFRKFLYSGRAPVLDPAPRILPADVLQTGELPVRGQTVTGEGTRAGEVEQLLLSGGAPAELTALGVGWVLVERTTPGPLGDSAVTLAGLTQVYADADLELYRVPDAGAAPRGEATYSATAGQRRWAGLAHWVWAGTLVGGLLVAAAAGGRTHREQQRHSA